MKPSKIITTILICLFVTSTAEAFQRHRAPVKTKPVQKVPVVSPEAEAIRNKKKVAFEEAAREATKIYNGIITQCGGAFYTKYFPGRRKFQEVDMRSRIGIPGFREANNNVLIAERGMLTDQIYFIEMKEITDRFSWHTSEVDANPNSDSAKLMLLNHIQWQGQYEINFKFSRIFWPKRKDQQGFNEFGTAWDEGGSWTEWTQASIAHAFYQTTLQKSDGEWSSTASFDNFTAPTCEEIKAGMPKEIKKDQ